MYFIPSTPSRKKSRLVLPVLVSCLLQMAKIFLISKLLDVMEIWQLKQLETQLGKEVETEEVISLRILISDAIRGKLEDLGRSNG
jgi:hypothetical protein